MSDLKPLSLSAFAKFWWCSCEHEVCGPNQVYLWEPLNTEAPENAKPYCFGIGEIDFYDHTGNIKIDKGVRCVGLSGVPDQLVWLDSLSKWYEVASGQVTYRKGRWHMRWYAFCNTRKAHFANHGMRIWNLSDMPRRTWLPRIFRWGGWHGWAHGAVWWRGKLVREW